MVPIVAILLLIIVALLYRQSLKRAAEKELILDSLIEGVATLDRRGVVQYVNPTFAKMMGLPRRELLLRPLASPKKEALVPDHESLYHSDCVKAPGVETIDKGGSIKFNTSPLVEGSTAGLSRSQNSKDFRGQALARCLALIKLATQKQTAVTDTLSLEDPQKTVLDLIVIPKQSGIIIILQDKSSQRQVVEMGKEFISNASHELRTPITIIKGFAETLQDLPSVSKSMLSEITEKMVRNCERMSNLVKNLLTLADLDHVSQSRFQPCDIVALSENCAHHLQTLFPTAKITLEKISDTLMVNASPDLLELALMNLLENGIKYSPYPRHLDPPTRAARKRHHLFFNRPGHRHPS